MEDAGRDFQGTRPPVWQGDRDGSRQMAGPKSGRLGLIRRELEGLACMLAGRKTGALLRLDV